jgi:tRNA nucleotidyltransferase (CCA-adding enzyme)
MELIATHISADFDAVASLVAASKLYPGARLLFPGAQERNVREFLRQHRLPVTFERLRGFPLDAVRRLILVDVKRRARIGALAAALDNPGVEVHLYDHHPVHAKDIAGSVEVLREVGATTTLLVGLLRERRLPIRPEEATLYALGIYEETGLFTFTSTTVADLEAAAHLLTCGANVSAVGDFIRRELTAEQVALLNDLLASLEAPLVNGLRVAIATASPDRYIGDLALVAHKLRDIENANVLFLLVWMDQRVHLVARSRLDAVDVADIAAAFGGGGHPTAASATMRGLTLVEARDRLMAVLHERIRPWRVARDLMVAPVRSVEAGASLAEASAVLNRYQMTLIPVVRDGALVGLLPRDAVDRGVFHGLRDRPIAEYMLTDPPCVAPEAPLLEVQQRMVERSLGLLPVVEGARLVGAVMRSDLLRVQYEEVAGRDLEERAAESAPPKDMTGLMASRLPERVQTVLKAAGGVAERVGMRAYVVGGFVRDLLLGVENWDVDLVVEGDGLAYAEALGRELPATVRPHAKFGTAALCCPDGFRLDVATARVEHYAHPAALPTVEHAALRFDLYRRDFTLNTLAIRLNGPDRGQLVDFFGGRRDLRDKVLRVIHTLSFVEDPTRILRAARFEARFGFAWSKQVEQLVKNAVQLRAFDRLSGRRILHELQLICEEPDPGRILRRLEGFRVLAAIHPALALGRRTDELFGRLKDVLAWYALLYRTPAPLPWRLYLMAILLDARPEVAREVADRLRVGERAAERLSGDLARVHALDREFALTEPTRPSAIARLLRPASLEAALLLMTSTERETTRRSLSDFLTTYVRVRIHLTGDDLKALGLPPGPAYQTILAALLDARLDGRVESREDEVRLVRERFRPGRTIDI